MTDHAERWEQRFARPGFMFGTAPNAFLRAQAHRFPPGGRVLVPGDGEGRNGVWLAGEGFAVTTLDWAAAGVAKALELARERGVALDARQADLLRWDAPDGSFDGVASVFVHLPPEERRVVHAALWRALKPGGVLVIEAFRPDQVALQRRSADGRGSGGPPDPALLFSAADLRADFTDGTWLMLEEAVTVLDEGSHHRGEAAITRGVVRKPGAPGAEPVSPRAPTPPRS